MIRKQRVHPNAICVLCPWDPRWSSLYVRCAFVDDLRKLFESQWTLVSLLLDSKCLLLRQHALALLVQAVVTYLWVAFPTFHILHSFPGMILRAFINARPWFQLAAKDLWWFASVVWTRAKIPIPLIESISQAHHASLEEFQFILRQLIDENHAPVQMCRVDLGLGFVPIPID